MIRWSLIGVAGILVLGWGLTWILAAKNQRRIEAFFAAAGSARTYADFARDADAVPRVAGNGWYHYLAAVASLSPATVERFGEPDRGAAAPTDADRGQRETELEAARAAIERAAGAAACVPQIDWGDPLADRPHAFAALRFARVASSSALDALAAGDPARAAGRVHDLRRITDALLVEPTMITMMITLAAQREAMAVVATGLPRLPEPSLRAADTWFAAYDERRELTRSLRGEIYFGLWCWDVVRDRSIQLVTEGRGVAPGRRPGWLESVYSSSFVFELDKAAYLDAMLPLVEDPLHASTPERPPFYAMLSRLVVPHLGSMQHACRRATAQRSLIREAIRLELARRATGTVPTPHAEVGGVTLVVEPGGDGIVLRLPSDLRDEAQPLEITIR